MSDQSEPFDQDTANALLGVPSSSKKLYDQDEEPDDDDESEQ